MGIRSAMRGIHYVMQDWVFWAAEVIGSETGVKFSVSINLHNWKIINSD